MSREKNDNSITNQSDAEQTKNATQPLISGVQRSPQLVSPWLRRWLRRGSEADPSGMRFVRQRPIAMTTANTQLLVTRVQRTADRSIAWKPDVGSLKPGMTDQLTGKVVARSQFKPIGVKPRTELGEEPAPTQEEELPLVGATYEPLPGEQEPAPRPQPQHPQGSLFDAIREQSEAAATSSQIPDILSRLPSSKGQVIPRPPRAKKRAKPRRPFVPPQSRLFAQVQEVSPDEPPSASGSGPSSAVQRHPAPGESDTEPPSSDDSTAQSRPGRRAPPGFGMAPASPTPAEQFSLEDEVSESPPSLAQPASPKEHLLSPPVLPDVPLEPSLLQRAVTQEMPLWQPLRETPPPSGEIDTVEDDPTTMSPPVKRALLDDSPLRAPVSPDVSKELPLSGIEKISAEEESPPPPVQPDSPKRPSPIQRALAQEMPVIGSQQKTDAPGASSPGQPVKKTEEPATPTEPKIKGESSQSLDKVVVSRAISKQTMPLSEPLPLVRPRRQTRITDKGAEQARVSRKPITSLSTIAPQVARAQLITRGWRFKAKAGDSPASPERVVQAVTSLEQSSSSGERLADEPRTTMEGLMGRDFGDVRVHKSDLSALNVQAATRNQDIYFDKSQDDDFEKPESMALLGHELSHVGQRGVAQPKAVVQTAILPEARMSPQVEREEAEADTAERTVLEHSRARQRPAISGMPAMPLLTSAPTLQRAEAPTAEVDTAEYYDGSGMEDHYQGMQGIREGFDESRLDQLESRQMQEMENFEELQVSLEEIIDDRLAEMLETLGLEEEEAEEPQGPNLDDLARQILPYIKRLIVVERERRA